jgi:hypothetical protein
MALVTVAGGKRLAGGGRLAGAFARKRFAQPLFSASAAWSPKR